MVDFVLYCKSFLSFFLFIFYLVPLEGLKSQSYFDEMRSNYIRELAKAISLRHKGVVASSQRFYHLTKVLDSMHEVSVPLVKPFLTDHCTVTLVVN